MTTPEAVSHDQLLTERVTHLVEVITKAALTLTPPTPAPHDYWTDDTAYEVISRARAILYAVLPAGVSPETPDLNDNIDVKENGPGSLAEGADE